MRAIKTISILGIFCFVIGATSTILYHKSQPQKIYVAGMIAERSEQELILDSDIIVDGYVKEIRESNWSNPDMKIEGKRNILQTDIVVTINELLSGEYKDKETVVRINTGYDKEKNIQYISEGYPEFTEGEHVLLYLSRPTGDLATDEDYFVLTGMYQGKWKIDDVGKIYNERKEATHLTNKKSIGVLKNQIQSEKQNNPDWQEKKLIEKEHIRKQNIELFGE